MLSQVLKAFYKTTLLLGLAFSIDEGLSNCNNR